MEQREIYTSVFRGRAESNTVSFILLVIGLKG
jgi:hypothetical protein